MCILYLIAARTRSRTRSRRAATRKALTIISRMPTQVKHMDRLVGVTDVDCVDNLRMDRNTFGRLCQLLRHIGGLKDGKYVLVEEQVAIFLGIVAHHKKNRIAKFDFWRSGQTISHYVHRVLNAILKMHTLFLVKPDPITDDCLDPRWKWFKGCLGALDGTYINMLVPNTDQPRYRTRKGQISTNTLAVCDRYMRFVYVLPGWEGSAADSRVLRDAVNRVHGLRVPKGNYYLCDNGYANNNGFLTPYKAIRYHFKDWGPIAEMPQNPKEIFNMRHTRARNVIERAFAVLKMRWGILRSAAFYPVKVQIRLIMAFFCFIILFALR
ncbi:uncharacterized protein LOC121800386 [Salvia splendens]|uniref:uncharacterized protein LOC121800386 n=1 Tax=Salvia splendens TaxID=180675 RepID=UPI001C264EED|nr:uncharacterized protein LOC121800386 [Salvia splendens]XP_042055892.1 uncharacterized protein LOC121800386 [Salvia splendens]XP_042055893.1 uncharacterized protein LOC121800386 [Salvia splendens]